MEIKSFLEGNQDLAEALIALPFIEELAETDYGSISLSKFIDIMGSNGFEAESLRRSLQQAVESLIVNNATTPEDPFSISLNDWKPLIGDETSNEIITAISNLNKEIDLVAGGTSSSNHKAARAVGATVVAAAGAATLTFAAKKLKENKNNLEKAIEIQAKIEACEFVESRDVPDELKTDWDNAKKEVERKAAETGVSLEEYERREFSDEFFRVGGLRGLATDAVHSNVFAIGMGGDLDAAGNRIRNELKKQATEYTKTRFPEFTREEAKKSLNSVVEDFTKNYLLKSGFPKLEDVSPIEVDKAVTEATDDILASSIKTLYEQIDLKDIISQKSLEQFIKGKMSESDLIEEIRTSSEFGKYKQNIGVRLTESEAETLTELPTYIGNHLKEITTDLIASMKEELSRDLRMLDFSIQSRILTKAKKMLKSDYEDGDLKKMIESSTKVRQASAFSTLFSDPEEIGLRFDDDLTSNIVKAVVKSIKTEAGDELERVIGEEVKTLAEQNLVMAKNDEIAMFEQKAEKKFLGDLQDFIDKGVVTELAKAKTKLWDEIEDQMAEDISDIRPGKIIENE